MKKNLSLELIYNLGILVDCLSKIFDLRNLKILIVLFC